MLNYPHGSLWNIWDLHLHTPSSYDYEDKSVTDEQIVEALRKANVRVAAITDHHVIDVARIRHLQELSGGEITILPGIELRSDQGGQPIHYVGIFPEDIELDHLWDTIRGQLELTPQGIKNKGGHEGVYIPIENAAPLFRDKLGGLVTIHAGAKSNSIEGISNGEQFQRRIKLDITNRFVDIMEIGQIKDIDIHLKKIFPDTGLKKPLIITPDNHNVSVYTRKAPCWLKADPTLRGLKEVIHEPTDRVCIGDAPPLFAHVTNNRTKYIRSVSIRKKADASLDENWFDCDIPLNHGLVAIIGNKGTGKSALADTLGLLGDASHGESFSFLNEKKFRRPKENKASHFSGTLTWESGDSATKSLDDPIEDGAVEKLKYIPQNHLEIICNELTSGEGGRFDKELKAVIFSHVGEPDRLGTKTLDELIEFRTKECEGAIGIIATELAQLNVNVARLEQKADPRTRHAIEAELAEKNKELASHTDAKPQEVSKPEADPKQQAAIQAISEHIDDLSAQAAKLDEEIASLKADLVQQTRIIAVADKLTSKLANFEQQVQAFRNEAASDLDELGLTFEKVITVDIRRDEINKIRKQAGSVKGKLEGMLSEHNQDGPVYNLRVPSSSLLCTFRFRNLHGQP